jgi:hypothetical protein
MKDLERHLGVSYPTARQRFADVLGRLGLDDSSSAPHDREQVLADLAAGRISVDQAEEIHKLICVVSGSLARAFALLRRPFMNGSITTHTKHGRLTSMK